MQHSRNEIRELSRAKQPLREFDCKRFKVCRTLCGDSLSLFSGLLTETFSRRGHLHKLGVRWCCLKIIWTWREDSSILSDHLWCLYTWRAVVPLVTRLVWKRSKNNQHSRQLGLGIFNKFFRKRKGGAEQNYQLTPSTQQIFPRWNVNYPTLYIQTFSSIHYSTYSAYMLVFDEKF